MKNFTYEQALNFIHSTYGMGHKDGLKNITELLHLLEDPQKKFRSVHVAGTNGKGSVCAFLHGVLCCAGYKVGLYTSPFLQRYNERIRIGGVPIPDDRLALEMNRVAEKVETLRAQGVMPTEFEIGTALAFSYFAAEQVDIAIIEVGLGGRLDPTNVIVPELSLIGSIGLDHTKILGNTLEQIAAEKAGIAKKGVSLLLTAQVEGGAKETIENCCKAAEAPFEQVSPEVLQEVRQLPLGLAGEHQVFNASLAFSACKALRNCGWKISDEHIREGLKRTRWPGRLEWIGHMLLDGAHNPQGAQALSDYVQKTLDGRQKVLLCGILKDKDWSQIAEILAGCADVCVTVSPDSHRALEAEALREYFEKKGLEAYAAGSEKEALEKAQKLAGKDGVVIAAGSLYLAGVLRTLALGQDDSLLQKA